MSKKKIRLYLTEENLNNKLGIIFPDNIVLHEERNFFFDFGGKKKRFVPDFVIEEKKLVIEFDGYGHFTTHDRVMRDILFEMGLKQSGWNIVRIPYFLQLTSRIVEAYFGKYGAKILDLSEGFGHGFIADDAIRPTDFCLSGLGAYAHSMAFLLENNLEDEYKLIRDTEMSPDKAFFIITDGEIAHTTAELFGESTYTYAYAFYMALKESMYTCSNLEKITSRKKKK